MGAAVTFQPHTKAQVQVTAQGTVRCARSPLSEMLSGINHSLTAISMFQHRAGITNSLSDI